VAATAEALVHLALLLEPLRLVLQLRDGEVDRRVQIGGHFLGEERLVIGLQGDLGHVAILRDAEDHVRVPRSVQVLLQAGELLFGVRPQGIRRIDVPERY
jgi:hypothetical protein